MLCSQDVRNRLNFKRDKFNKTNGYMLQEKLWVETKSDKNKWADGDFKRIRAYKAPGQEMRFKRRHLGRKRNREQVSFLCRYILTKKNGTRVPLK